MNTTGISYRRQKGSLYVKVDGWPFGSDRHGKAYVCSCNVCDEHSKAGWLGSLGERIESRCSDRDGAKKGRVIYLVDYAIGGYRPVAALTYHVTGYQVLQVLAAGISNTALIADADGLIAILLSCADAIALKTALRQRIEWLCVNEEEADEVSQIHGFTSGRRLTHGSVVVRRPFEGD